MHAGIHVEYNIGKPVEAKNVLRKNSIQSIYSGPLQPAFALPQELVRSQFQAFKVLFSGCQTGKPDILHNTLFIQLILSDIDFIKE